jgi:hypothetical protein
METSGYFNYRSFHQKIYHTWTSSIMISSWPDNEAHKVLRQTEQLFCETFCPGRGGRSRGQPRIPLVPGITATKRIFPDCWFLHAGVGKVWLLMQSHGIGKCETAGGRHRPTMIMTPEEERRAYESLKEDLRHISVRGACCGS